MPNYKWETFFLKQGFTYIAGVDEVGRGALSGPVVAAAVILNPKKKIKGLDDSKKLSPKKRSRLFRIIERDALAIGIGIVDSITIDRLNIAQASLLAMECAAFSLSPKAEILLIDGKCDIKSSIPQKHIVKGDSVCQSISAASIIAKVARDKIMGEFGKKFPDYGFAKHKGYGTREHMENIKNFGPCAIHRKTFYPMSSKRRLQSNLTEKLCFGK